MHNVKTDSSQSTILNFLTTTVAMALAFTTGWSFSGMILIAGQLLQPSLSFIPLWIYNGIIQFSFISSVITWSATYYGGLKSLFSPAVDNGPTSILEEFPIVENTSTILDINLHTEQAKDLLNKALGFNQQDVMAHLKAEQDFAAKIYAKPKSVLRTIPYLITRLSGIKFVSAYLSHRRQAQYEKRIALLAQSIKRTNSISGLSDNTVKDAQKENVQTLIKILIKQLEKSTPIPSYKPAGILSSVMNMVTLANTFAINNIGSVMFGALSVIPLLGLGTTGAWAMVIYFALVGSLGAYSFSRPGVLEAVQELLIYDNTERKLLADARAKGMQNGFFGLRPSLQQALAVFMGIGIAIGNFTANIAMGEVLFSNKSLFEPGLIGRIMTNPFSAAPISIAFGIFGGVATWALVTLLLIKGTLSITPKSTQAKTTESPVQRLRRVIVGYTKLTFGLGSAVVARAMVSGRAILPLLNAHLTLIFASALILNGCYHSYEQCRDDQSNFLTNLLVTTTIVGSSLATLYLNSMPGSLYANLFGNAFAKLTAGVTAVANAELSLPLFNDSKACLNSWMPTFPSYAPSKAEHAQDETSPLKV